MENISFSTFENNGLVKIDAESTHLEPYEYYNYLKSKLETQEQEKLDNELKILFDTLQKCNMTGQVNLSKNIKFNIDCILKERTLLCLGIKEYIDKDTVQQFVDTIKPKNSIKIIELQRYPRDIPEKEAKLISIIKRKNIFDQFYIVFTDLTKNDYKTDEERELVRRNRDPICFGMFEDNNIHKKFRRMYKICDWADDYCDLTFEKMIDKMNELNITPTNGIINGFEDTSDIIDQYQHLFNE